MASQVATGTQAPASIICTVTFTLKLQQSHQNNSICTVSHKQPVRRAKAERNGMDVVLGEASAQPGALLKYAVLNSALSPGSAHRK